MSVDGNGGHGAGEAAALARSGDARRDATGDHLGDSLGDCVCLCDWSVRSLMCSLRRLLHACMQTGMSTCKRHSRACARQAHANACMHHAACVRMHAKLHANACARHAPSAHHRCSMHACGHVQLMHQAACVVMHPVRCMPMCHAPSAHHCCDHGVDAAGSWEGARVGDVQPCHVPHLAVAVAHRVTERGLKRYAW